jgi:Ca-activated chloride channel homolog
MRKSSVLLFLFLLAAATGALTAQTRARRVGQGSAPGATTGEPSRPPVLGGSKTTTSQPPSQHPGTGTTSSEEVGAGDVVRVSTTLVTLPVSVLDRDGRYVPNLGKADFRLWEDGVEQEVAFFASVDKPFSVVLMLDTSGSTRFRLEDIQDAAITFVNQLRSDDRVMVVSFDDNIRVLSEFTNDRHRLREAIMRTRPGEGTKLYDAVDLVINQKLDRVSGRKAIVLFTDGVDTTSRHASYASNIRDAEELDALIYPVQYDTYTDVNGGGSSWPGRRRSPSSPVDILAQILGGMGTGRNRGPGGGGPRSARHDYDLASRYLADLAEKTGAREYQADSTQNLASAFSQIAEELRRQYSLGYYPRKAAQPGQRVQIRVRVNQPNLAVRTRDSYIFNPSGNLASQDTAAEPSPPVLRRKMVAERDLLRNHFNR